MEEPILCYPESMMTFVLFTDASKYVWACMLTQSYEHEVDEKKIKFFILSLIWW